MEFVAVVRGVVLAGPDRQVSWTAASARSMAPGPTFAAASGRLPRGDLAGRRHHSPWPPQSWPERPGCPRPDGRGPSTRLVFIDEFRRWLGVLRGRPPALGTLRRGRPA